MRAASSCEGPVGVPPLVEDHLCRQDVLLAPAASAVPDRGSLAGEFVQQLADSASHQVTIRPAVARGCAAQRTPRGLARRSSVCRRAVASTLIRARRRLPAVGAAWQPSGMDAHRRPLFDGARRTDGSPGKHRESTFEFLNRVAGDYWEHPRDLMQQWLDHVSSGDEYMDLRNRLRSRDDDQFRSAFLELYLHKSLLRAGYEVTIHPDVAGTSSRPDFSAERDGERIYVEAIAPGATPTAKAAAQRRAVLFDVVDQVPDLRFYLWLNDLSDGPRPPAAARLRADLTRWLSTLDPTSEIDLDRAATYEWTHDGWSATFKAIPAGPGPQRRGADHRAIGVYGHTRAGIVDDAPWIRKALTSKHRKYGDLDAPFVVAIGTYNFDSDRWHATNALYGGEAYRLSETEASEIRAQPFRHPDGYFGAPPRWQNRHVAGVLVVNQLMPYHVQRAEVTLWRHPAPFRGLPRDLGIPAATVQIEGRQLDQQPPTGTAQDFFGLSDPWPPGEPWSGRTRYGLMRRG